MAVVDVSRAIVTKRDWNANQVNVVPDFLWELCIGDQET